MTAANENSSILIVDDEQSVLKAVEMTLRSEGFESILQCQDSRNVMKMLKENHVCLLFLDMNMPHKPGNELLPEIVHSYPDLPIIIMTGIQEVETVVTCIKAGAYNYLVKPVDNHKLTTYAHKALEFSSIREENTRLKNSLLTEGLKKPMAFESIPTREPAIHGVFKYIEAVAESPLPVLILGETGVGKELFARAVHLASGRSGDLISVNISGLDDHALYDTLFGHRKGAFTGADNARKGLVEHARGGTLFLDEIGDLSLDAQIKFLRLLQEGSYYPLGADTPRRANTHFIAATNCNLEAQVKQHTFRSDIYYRLQNHKIIVPPLRERKEDIPLLLDSFLEQASDALRKPVPTCPPELLTLLRSYTFPGNIRELRSMVFDAVSRHDKGILSMASFRDKIRTEDLSSSLGPDKPGKLEDYNNLYFPSKLPTLKELTESLIQEAMARAEDNQSLAAAMLGITRQALNKRLQKEYLSKKVF